MLSIYAPKSAWTPELKQEVCDLWGTMTARQIEAVLNERGYTFTRNAIIGQLNRSGKTIEHKTAVHPQTPDKGPRRPRVKAPAQPVEGRVQLGIGTQVQAINRARIKAAKKPELKPEPFVVQVVADVEPLNKRLIDLEPGECRYVYGDQPSEMVFCGHPTLRYKVQGMDRESSYCRSHHMVCTTGLPIPKRAGFIDLGKSSGGVFGRVA